MWIDKIQVCERPPRLLRSRGGHSQTWILSRQLPCSVQHERDEMRWSGRCRRRAALSAPATGAATTATSAACTRCGLWTTGNGNVLLAVKHERHRRPHLRKMRIKIEKLLAGIRAICDKPIDNAGENEIPSGRESSTLVESG